MSYKTHYGGKRRRSLGVRRVVPVVKGIEYIPPSPPPSPYRIKVDGYHVTRKVKRFGR